MLRSQPIKAGILGMGSAQEGKRGVLRILSNLHEGREGRQCRW